MASNMNNVTVSIVSHKHGVMIRKLLDQLCRYHEKIHSVILTFNVQEEEEIVFSDYPYKIREIRNPTPKGFGENHNKAFNYCNTDYFCAMNPDISLNSEPFGPLIHHMNENKIDIIAPIIVNVENEVEDSARFFPTPLGLLKKIWGDYSGVYPLKEKSALNFPDWVAGMFMLIRSASYRSLRGFDESFFYTTKM